MSTGNFGPPPLPPLALPLALAFVLPPSEPHPVVVARKAAMVSISRRDIVLASRDLPCVIAHLQRYRGGRARARRADPGKRSRGRASLGRGRRRRRTDSHSRP